MTHKLFSPSEVAHIWAQQNQAEGSARESGGGGYSGGGGGARSAYFTGPVLYSYGSHFVSGVIVRPERNGDGLAFVTAEKNSITTNARVSEAWHSVSHYAERYRLPTISRDIQDAFAALRTERKTIRDYVEGEGYVDRPLSAVARAYIRTNAADFDSDGCAARAFGRLFGLTPAAVDRAIMAGRADADKAKAAEAKREADSRIERAREVADASESFWRGQWPADGSGREYEEKQAARFLKDLNAALREARAANKAGRFATAKLTMLKGRVAQYREHAAGLPDRVRNAARIKIENDAVNWLALRSEADMTMRQGSAEGVALFYIGRDSCAPSSATLEEWAPNLAAEVRAAKIARQATYYGERFADWQRNPANRDLRPNPSDYETGSAARVAIEADQAAERDALAAAYLAWDSDKSAPRPSSRLFLTGPLRERFGGEAYNRLSEAERHEKEAKAWADWRAGVTPMSSAPRRAMADGSAYIRRSRDGESLETSQSASVPWDHALRAFRFLKLCRERGEAFSRNGRTIRVGHYQVDRINPDGSFVAGCHRFAWSEIERLAQEQGVFALEPSAAAVESSH